jgi:hypothetical protein
LEAGNSSIGTSLKRLRTSKKHQLDAFTLGIIHLAGVCRHLRTGAAIDDRHLARSAAKRSARRIQSGVPAPNHQHAVAGCEGAVNISAA